MLSNPFSYDGISLDHNCGDSGFRGEKDVLEDKKDNILLALIFVYFSL